MAETAHDMSLDAHATAFEPLRPRLTGLAYRMLGSLADAEDVVQDAWLRWSGEDCRAVAQPAAYLSKVVTRLCLDRLKSARAQRETYVGPWLPEPIVDDSALAAQAATEYAADLSFALLMALERLSPLERAAFLLHDVFDMEFAEVAETLGRDEAACRQLAARARAHIREARPRYRSSPGECRRLTVAFMAAAQTGNADQLRQLLADDAVLYTDGGGKVTAALRPIAGGARIAEFVLAILRSRPAPRDLRVRETTLNGVPGVLLEQAEGPLQTVTVEAHDGRIQRIYIVRNPEKLRRLARSV